MSARNFLELEAALPHGIPTGSGNAAYTLPQAAAALEISERTLRAMVARGEIAAEKTERGHYRIAAAVVESLRHADRQRQRQEPCRAATGSGSGIAARQAAATPTVVEELRAEVAFLRAELEGRRQAEADLRATIGRLAAALEIAERRALPWAATSPEPAPIGATDSTPMGAVRRWPWWRFWRRRPAEVVG